MPHFDLCSYTVFMARIEGEGQRGPRNVEERLIAKLAQVIKIYTNEEFKMFQLSNLNCFCPRHNTATSSKLDKFLKNNFKNKFTTSKFKLGLRLIDV